MADFSVSDLGSIVLLTPLTEVADQWLDDNIGDEAAYMGPALVIEHRYAGDIIEGVLADGLEVE